MMQKRNTEIAITKSTYMLKYTKFEEDMMNQLTAEIQNLNLTKLLMKLLHK